MKPGAPRSSSLALLRSLNGAQRSVVLASFLGWTLDAFDFFLVVFVLKDIAAEFHSEVKEVTFAILLTLALRPIGAFAFGLLADRYGRRPTLMADVLAFSLMELLTAFSPTLTVFLVLRALYGIAMGGEWGVGASLALESIPAETRGIVSGILQQGYACGYLLAAVAYYALFPLVGWRGLFVVGVLPALLVLFIRIKVRESPTFERRPPGSVLGAIRSNARRFAYMVMLMAAFNFLSHGTQDLYPTFLQVQRGMGVHEVGLIAIIYNLGALTGGILVGALSQRIGRRRAIVGAVVLTLPIIPLWAYAQTPVLLALGAFALQFMVQGAWGVVPVHLNELSPEGTRGTFPGFTYQLGNLLASANATLQAGLAHGRGGDYAFALALVAVLGAVTLAVLTLLGPEARGQRFGGS
jgi:SHS family lactate transporter-like MFS transporter